MPSETLPSETLNSETLPSETSTWSSIRDILRRGDRRNPPVVLRRKRHLRRALRTVGGLLQAHPFLIPPFLADPSRLLRGLGFVLEGAAQRDFDTLLGDRHGQLTPEHYEASLDAPLPAGLEMRVEIPKTLGGDSDDGDLPDDLGRRLGQLDQMARQRKPRRRASTARRPDTSDRPGSDRPWNDRPDPPDPDDDRGPKQLPDPEGTTSGWDVVVQLDDELVATSTGMMLDAQSVGSLFGSLLGPNDTEFVDNVYTLETWFLVHVKVELRFIAGVGDRKATLAGMAVDEVGLEQEVRVKTWRRWTTEDPWEETDSYSATVMRRAPLVRKKDVKLGGGVNFKRIYAADFAGGTSDITIQTPPWNPDDRYADRAPLLELALDSYFAKELPYLPITPEFSAAEPWVAWPHAVGFTRHFSQRPYGSHGAVSLCFRQDADAGEHDDPYRAHILHDGRNVALGIAAKVIRSEIEKQVGQPPIPAGSSTITGYRFDFHSDWGGYVSATFDVDYKLIFRFPVTYTAYFDVSVHNNQLKVVLTESDLDLPLSLYLVGFGLLSWVGVLTVAIGKVFAKTGIDKAAEGLLDLGDTFGDLLGALGGDSEENDSQVEVSTDLDSVEINEGGVFLRGNLEITPAS